MPQMEQGETKESSVQRKVVQRKVVQRKVQLGSKTELTNWADIGPKSVAAAVRYRKEPERKQQE